MIHHHTFSYKYPNSPKATVKRGCLLKNETSRCAWIWFHFASCVYDAMIPLGVVNVSLKLSSIWKYFIAALWNYSLELTFILWIQQSAFCLATFCLLHQLHYKDVFWEFKPTLTLILHYKELELIKFVTWVVNSVWCAKFYIMLMFKFRFS